MKKQHGGKRPGAGRPKGTKSSQNVKFLGFYMYKEEQAAIQAASKAEDVTPSFYVVKHSVLAACNQDIKQKNKPDVKRRKIMNVTTHGWMQEE